MTTSCVEMKIKIYCNTKCLALIITIIQKKYWFHFFLTIPNTFRVYNISILNGGRVCLGDGEGRGIRLVQLNRNTVMKYFCNPGDWEKLLPLCEISCKIWLNVCN